MNELFLSWIFSESVTRQVRGFVKVEQAIDLGKLPNFWTQGYSTDYLSGRCFCLSGVFKRLFDRRRGSPGDFAEVFAEPLDFRLFLYERFDFHCSAAFGALQRVYLKYSFHTGSPISRGAFRRIYFRERFRGIHRYSLSTAGAR